MKFPETDPASYSLWMDEGWYSYVLNQLKDLRNFIREYPISGLDIGGLHMVCFMPFGGPDLFNRKAALFLHEIEAYNQRNPKESVIPHGGSVNEHSLEYGWALSGLERPR